MGPQPAHKMLLKAFILLTLTQLLSTVQGCLKNVFGGESGRRGKSLLLSNSDLDNNALDLSLSSAASRVKIHNLNREGDLVSITRTRVYEGDQYFGRLIVPWSNNDWTLSVTAMWDTYQHTTPLWMYLKKSSLPTSSDWDKTSISFISRQYSRIREESADSGLYFVMVEALTDLRNLTLAVTLLPPSDQMEKRENLLLISQENNQWATKDRVP